MFDNPPPQFEIRLDSLASYRPEIISYLNTQKSNAVKEGRRYTVLDVGGISDSWSWSIVDVILDGKISSQVTTKQLPPHITFYQGDITLESGWSQVESYVALNGLFDFVICAHTIEDLHNPGVAIDKITKISKGGHIVVPYRFMELDRGVSVGASRRMGFNEENGMGGR